jgi:hypothetical protein
MNNSNIVDARNDSSKNIQNESFIPKEIKEAVSLAQLKNS